MAGIIGALSLGLRFTADAATTGLYVPFTGNYDMETAVARLSALKEGIPGTVLDEHPPDHRWT
jgi:hypothetical protein